MQCPRCENQVQSDAKFCSECGADLTALHGPLLHENATQVDSLYWE